jgi:hypothetical protein
MSKIVVLHDVSQVRHPSFESTVGKRPKTGHIVDTVSASGILLFSIGAVKDNVEFDSVQVGKGLSASCDDGRV